MPMAVPAARLRKDLSVAGLVDHLREAFRDVPDPRRAGSVEHALPDVLSAAFAMFHLRFGSLLDFDTRAHTDPRLIHNLEHLYRLDSVPSDTQMRTVLDSIPPKALRPAVEALHGQLQRGRALEDFVSWGGARLSLPERCGTERQPPGPAGQPHRGLGD